MIAAILSSRSSFVLAALFVSWVAVGLLVLVAANLHFRLVHLEKAQPAAAPVRTPFPHLLGKSLPEALGSGAPPDVRVAVVLSANCATCDQLVAWLWHSATSVPVALLWRDETTGDRPAVPPSIVVVDDGAAVSRALGVRVTPFALVADEVGQVVRAAPVGSVDAFAAILDDLDRSAPRHRVVERVPVPSLLRTPSSSRGG